MNTRVWTFLAAVAVVGASWLTWVDRRYEQFMSEGKQRLAIHAARQGRAEIDRRFNEAVAMLHAGQYDYAIKSLHRVLELNPRMPEAHVNMGFAFLGLEEFRAAHDFFQAAIDLRPDQVNAYFGLAEALIGLNDAEGALGAMRVYVHLAPPTDPFVAKAKATIGELRDVLAPDGG